MSNTTKENVKAIAPEFTAVTDALFNLILSDVALEVSSEGYGAKQEQAQRYLTAHYLTIIDAANTTGTGASNSGVVTKEKVGEVEIDYADTTKTAIANIKDPSRYDETKYGRVFKTVSRTAITPFRVFTP